MIYTHIPFSLNRNYGKAVNQFMELLNDDDWAVIMDYDVLFTTNHWYDQVTKAIELGDALITCPTNRTANVYQRAPQVLKENHNIEYHYKKGKELYDFHKNEVKDFPSDHPMSGYVMIFPKTLWREIGGFKEGQYSVDNDVHMKAVKKGYPIRILPGCYVYHAYFRL